MKARVLIVDDSRIFRAALEEALAGSEDAEVVGSVFSGERALEFLRDNAVDLVSLDVEMPGMNGLETLAAIQRLNAARADRKPVGVLMVSAFTRRGADITVKALQAGAFDFVTKPDGPDAEANRLQLRCDVLARVRAFRRPGHVPCAASRPPTPAPPARSPLRAVVVGVSTGGPRALETLLPDLCKRVSLPVLVVQHMPPPFTHSLAEHLARQTGRPVVEARDGDPVRPGTVYIAPGGRHLLLRGGPTGLVTGLADGPPECGCRPSADVLFRSAAAVLGGDVAAVVLTGMGCDGTAGLRPLKRAGAHVIAQDEKTCVVWGMPGSAVTAGLVDEVLPLERIPAAVAAAALLRNGGRP